MQLIRASLTTWVLPLVCRVSTQPSHGTGKPLIKAGWVGTREVLQRAVHLPTYVGRGVW